MGADESARRVAAVRRRLVDLELDGLVVAGLENIRYLSGFSGSRGYPVIGSAGGGNAGETRAWPAPGRGRAPTAPRRSASAASGGSAGRADPGADRRPDRRAPNAE